LRDFYHSLFTLFPTLFAQFGGLASHFKAHGRWWKICLVFGTYLAHTTTCD